ncbi:hypothetical protein CAPTEDRAFT_18759 [Capitella teleta]|uniref:UspA domain-containing protein n=1 Tax=Capitella teleta TaxID=283909 RepID=R7TZJ7_CAPTE|nr:hypothetical protein CAPTEDRAFT_18759 [Capitella teleta]|eukprot:ELT99194.1 hypothetical protein CAPTEDRAFT_18759 [Capitella teleta]
MATGQVPLTVIVAIDGSDIAEFALNWYLDGLHKEGNKVILFHAEEPLTVIGEVPSVESYEQMVEDGRQRSEKLEDKFRKILQNRNVQGEVHSVYGNRPGETVVESARKHGVDLIVMGTRGLNRNRRTMMGSCSDYVTHHAHCPVLVCRQGEGSSLVE